jgi:hypothetical protein
MEKENKDYASSLALLKTEPDKRQGHQFLGYEQGQIFFKLFLVKVILVIRNSTNKKV